MRNTICKAALLFLLFAGLFFTPLLAQTNTATIVGIVQDESGAVVPVAAVTIKSLGTGETRSVQSSANGEYTFASLQVGHYSLTVTHEGFATVEIADTEHVRNICLSLSGQSHQ